MTQDGSRDDVTGLLIKWREGDKAALDALIPLVYQELRRVARARLRGERQGHSLQTTALVHEVYLRLVNIDRSRAWFVDFLGGDIFFDIKGVHQRVRAVRTGP